MAYSGNKVTYSSAPEILASEKFVSFTETIPQAMGVNDGSGRLIVKMGTVFPANNATAKGLVLTDIDVTDGNAVGSVLVGGYVYAERLPVAIDPLAAPKLTEIKFR